MSYPLNNWNSIIFATSKNKPNNWKIMTTVTDDNMVIGKKKSTDYRNGLPFTEEKDITAKDAANWLVSINPFDNRKKLEKAKEELDNTIKEYESEGELLNKDLIRLYELRKQTVNRMQEIYDCLNQLQNCDPVLLNSMGLAWGYVSVFREVVKWDDENSLLEESNKDIRHYSVAYETVFGKKPKFQNELGKNDVDYSNSTSANIAIGATSITAIASVAALESMTFAAGGATSFSLLSLAGPIGSVIGGSAMIVTGILAMKKAKEKINKINEGVDLIKSKLDIIKAKHRLLNLLIFTTEKLRNKINTVEFSQCSKNYLSNDFPRQDVQQLVDDCKLMGKLINERIEG